MGTAQNRCPPFERRATCVTMVAIEDDGVKRMQLTINIGYDQIYELVRQLPATEKIRLVQEGVFATAFPFPKSPEPELSDEEYYEFLMNFPVVSDEEIERILEAKKEVDQCRPVSL